MLVLKFPVMFLFETNLPPDLHILTHEFVEIPLIVMGLVLVVFLLYITSKTTLAVHIHLRILILNLIVASAATSIFRIISLVVLLTVDAPHVHQVRRPVMALRYIAQYTGSFNLFFNICERLYATWNAHVYEQISAVRRLLALIVFEWVVVSFYIVLSVTGSIDGIVAVIIEIVINVLILILFTLVVSVQAMFYKKAKLNVVYRNRHSLTERYQIKENFASTKAFLPTLVFLCTVTFCGTALYTIAYGRTSNDTLFIICDLLLALKLFALPILLIVSHKALMTSVCRLFRRSNKVSGEEGTKAATTQKYATAKVSAIPVTDQGAVYFRELQKNWNNKR